MAGVPCCPTPILATAMASWASLDGPATAAGRDAVARVQEVAPRVQLSRFSVSDAMPHWKELGDGTTHTIGTISADRFHRSGHLRDCRSHALWWSCPPKFVVTLLLFRPQPVPEARMHALSDAAGDEVRFQLIDGCTERAEAISG